MLDPYGTFRPNVISIAPILSEQQAGNKILTLELNAKFDAVAITIRKAAPIFRFDFVTARQKTKQSMQIFQR